MNLGNQKAEFKPQAKLRLESVMTEVQVRIHASMVDDTLFETMSDNATKLMALSLKDITLGEIFRAAEPLSTAYRVKARANNAEDSELVLGYWRVRAEHATKLLSLSGKEGIIISAAGGKRDQDWSVSIVPLKPEFKMANEDMQLMTDIQAKPGEDFAGMVPMSATWDRWGVRVRTPSYAEARTKLTEWVGEGSVVQINNKYLVGGVPKGVSRKELEEKLELAGWKAVVLNEMRGRQFQQGGKVTFMVGAMDEAATDLMYLEDGAAITIERHQRKEEADRGPTKWASKLLQQKVQCEEKEQTDEGVAADTEQGLAEPITFSGRMKVAAIALKFQRPPPERKEQPTSSSSEDIQPPSAKKPLVTPSTSMVTMRRNENVCKEMVEHWITQTVTLQMKTATDTVTKEMMEMSSKLEERTRLAEERTLKLEAEVATGKNKTEALMAAIMSRFDDVMTAVGGRNADEAPRKGRRIEAPKEPATETAMEE